MEVESQVHQGVVHGLLARTATFQYGHLIASLAREGLYIYKTRMQQGLPAVHSYATDLDIDWKSGEVVL